MKLAVIGSRNLKSIEIGRYIPDETDEIVSGGALGVDSLASEYARSVGIKLTEFLPDYERYGRGAPILRNKKIVDYADKILAFWDGVRVTLRVPGGDIKDKEKAKQHQQKKQGGKTTQYAATTPKPLHTSAPFV